MDDKDGLNRGRSTEFTTESTTSWTLGTGESDDIGDDDSAGVYFFGSSRDSSILSEFGWNLQPETTASFDRIHSDLAGNTACTGNSSSVVDVNPECASSAAATAATASVGAERVPQAEPMSSSSSEDQPEKSTASIDSAAPPPAETAIKAKKKSQKRIRQPRFAFMTKSEVDHLEDGYRWRKYGQKAVKNSPFPRSYYRCTNSKCMVKKRVERSCEDPTIVITTYEGQHCHHTVGFPRGGLIAHEATYGSHLGSSTSQFYFPGTQLPQSTSPRTPQLQRQSPGDVGQSRQAPERRPQVPTDEGLLGDMVPPGMR